MPGARHFQNRDEIDEDTLAADIRQDITASHGAAKDLEAAGQTGAAQRMHDAADAALDEYSALKNGTWRPEFGH